LRSREPWARNAHVLSYPKARTAGAKVVRFLKNI
jgi:hypothetical protein